MLLDINLKCTTHIGGGVNMLTQTGVYKNTMIMYSNFETSLKPKNILPIR